MSTEQQIWQSLSSSPMSQLADLLTAYDNAIGRAQHGLKPGSELAIRIYSYLIRKWKDGSLKDLVKVTQLNTFSFGKQNPFSSPKDLKAKKLTFDESYENTRRIYSKTTNSLADRTTRAVSLEDLERKLTRYIHIKRKTEVIKSIEFHFFYSKLKKLVLRRHLIKLTERLSHYEPIVIKNRLRRFKLENAIYFDEARLRGLFFRNWRKIAKIHKQNRYNAYTYYQKFKNYQTLSCFFKHWLDYTNRKEYEKLQYSKTRETKQKLRKLLFYSALKRFLKRPYYSAKDYLKSNRLAMKLLYHRLKALKIKNKTHRYKQTVIYSVIISTRAPSFFRALKENAQQYDLYVSKLIYMRRFLHGRKLLSAMYFSSNTNKQDRKTKGPKQMPFVCLLLSALEWQNRRFGYHEGWMADMALLDAFQEARIRKLAFYGLQSRLRQYKYCSYMIKQKRKQRVGNFITNGRYLLEIRQNNEKSSFLIYSIREAKIRNVFSKFSEHKYHNNKIKYLNRSVILHKILQFFNRTSIQSLSYKYRNRQLENHIQIKNHKIVKKCFEACRYYLLERSLTKKIAMMTEIKSNNRIVKSIFQFLKFRAFYSKRRQLKTINLIKLRRLHYGCILIRLVKQIFEKSHDLNELKQQALRLYRYNTENRVFDFIKIRTRMHIMHRVIQERIDLERNNKTLFIFFGHLKKYWKKRREYRRDDPNTKIINNKAKKRILYKWLNRTIISIKLDRLSTIHQKYLKRFMWKLMVD